MNLNTKKYEHTTEKIHNVITDISDYIDSNKTSEYEYLIIPKTKKNKNFIAVHAYNTTTEDKTVIFLSKNLNGIKIYDKDLKLKYEYSFKKNCLRSHIINNDGSEIESTLANLEDGFINLDHIIETFPTQDFECGNSFHSIDLSDEIAINIRSDFYKDRMECSAAFERKDPETETTQTFYSQEQEDDFKMLKSEIQDNIKNYYNHLSNVMKIVSAQDFQFAKDLSNFKHNFKTMITDINKNPKRPDTPDVADR